MISLHLITLTGLLQLVGALKLTQINSVGAVRRRLAAQKEAAEGERVEMIDEAETASKFTNNSQEIPADLMAPLLKYRVQEPDCQNGWVLDGYPRERKHSDALVAAGVLPCKIVVLKVPEKVLMEKQCYRRIDPQNQDIHDVRDEQIPADVRERLVTRDQDKEEVVREKIHNYDTQTEDMLKAFDPSLILEVDGEQSMEQMVEQIKKAVGK